MAAKPSKPPIVLIHGLWMTPGSWSTWADRFRAAGHDVIVPGWPGVDDRGVEAIRSDPSALKNVRLAQVADHLEGVIRALPSKPIIMGHSFGGLLTQMLAERDLGVAYVGVASAQPAGITTLPASTLRTGLPILGNPFGFGGASPISKAHFHYVFGNDLSRSESDAVWQSSAINSFNRVFVDGVLALFNEKGGVSRVNFAKADRAPLLLIAGSADHAVPPAIVNAIFARYTKAGTSIVEKHEFVGRTHRIVSQPGWEEVADFALNWAEANAAAHAKG